MIRHLNNREPVSAEIGAILERQSALQMPLRALAKSAGVTNSEMVGILRHNAVPTHLQIKKLSAAVGLSFSIDGQLMQSHTVDDFRMARADTKARFLAKLVQGTMLLEGQGLEVSGVAELISDNRDRLLADPRRLWG